MAAEVPSTVPYATYSALLDQHEQLLRDHEICLEKLHRARLKLENDRHKIGQWRMWYDKQVLHRNAIRTPSPAKTTQGNLVQREPASPRIPEDQPHVSSEASSPHLLPILLPTGPLQDGHMTARDDDLLPILPEQKLPSSPLGLVFQSYHASSQTTQSDQDRVSSAIKATDTVADDDEPIVVSTRVIRKPRQAKTIKTEPDVTPIAAPSDRVKRGRYQADGQRRVPSVKVQSSQISDLDNINGLVTTPRKRQRLGDETVTRRRSLRIAPLDDGPPLEPLLVDRHISFDTDIDAENVPEIQQVNTLPLKSESSLRASRRSAGPLTPISSNTPAVPREDVVTARKLRRIGPAARFKVVTEDGNSQADQKPSPQKDMTLGNLLEGATPLADKPRLTPRAPATARRTSPAVPPRDPDSHSGPASPEKTRVLQPVTLAKGVSRPEGRSHSPMKQLPPVMTRRVARLSMNHDTANDGPPAVRPEDEPLRSRPVDRLNLFDFVINPAYAGTDYAYHESARTREAKSCLPGCTRQECCGDLLRFAQAEYDDLSPNTPYNATTNAQHHSELREYLGRGYSTFMASHPSRTNILDMVRRARAQAWVDKYGRHRKVFEKGSTPPGFWRTEMPSTQDMVEDRKEAERREREKVQERWMDAVRGQQRWIFRDER